MDTPIYYTFETELRVRPDDIDLFHYVRKVIA
jgi:hypothetical protein